MTASVARLRPVEVLRAGWGAVLLARPGLVLERVHRVRVDTASRRITRAATPPTLSRTMESANGIIRSPASQAG